MGGNWYFCRSVCGCIRFKRHHERHHLGNDETTVFSELTSSGEALVDSLYNYTKNGGTYEVTFLEFGSTGCPACKRMESVMDEVRQKYPEKVNVVFLNILKPEN